MYARTAEAVTEKGLRAVFGIAVKIVPFGLLAHDDPVNGTGSAAPANSPEAVAQAADGSSTRPLGWNYCAFLEFASYTEAARAYEAQLDRTRAASAANEAVVMAAAEVMMPSISIFGVAEVCFHVGELTVNTWNTCNAVF